MIKEKLSRVFEKFASYLADLADEIALQSYAPLQDIIDYGGSVKKLPKGEFITQESKAMKAVVPADFNPYYRASLVVAENLSEKNAGRYSIYICLERRAGRNDGAPPHYVEYFPLMKTHDARMKNDMLRSWNEFPDAARSWLSKDMGMIPGNKWRVADTAQGVVAIPPPRPLKSLDI